MRNNIKIQCHNFKGSFFLTDFFVEVFLYYCRGADTSMTLTLSSGRGVCGTDEMFGYKEGWIKFKPDKHIILQWKIEGARE